MFPFPAALRPREKSYPRHMEGIHSEAWLGEEAQVTCGGPAKAQQWQRGSEWCPRDPGYIGPRRKGPRETQLAWGSQEGVLQGQAQALMGVARKEMQMQCAANEREVMELKGIALALGDPKDWGKIKLRQQELRSLVENHARKYVTAVHCQQYEVGDKVGKLLAWLKRRDIERTWVLKVEKVGHVLQTSGTDIAETFADYYKDLYTSRSTMSTEDCTDLLQDIHLQVLQDVNRDALEGDMAEEKVTCVRRGPRPDWDPS
ncbi:hypothetical protein NDU88_003137 [Pleurodeles waltl]|uniref:Uncharacterized protein n=1 Tax=Pleurodeles waltl TaxID=8319 RepID=A0AAV7RHE1_PLEWA|nr:hypothetical protein NDU88_003137 [Pleurodeles waltl]